MIPFIRSGAEYTLTVPEISGGLNLRDSLSSVADDQLTECENMWFKDGALRTRPRFKSNTSVDGILKVDKNETDNYSVKSFDGCSAEFDGEKYILQVISKAKRLSDGKVGNSFCFRYVSAGLDVIKVGEIVINSTDRVITEYIVFQQDGDVYFFTGAIEQDYWVIKKKNGQGLFEEPERRRFADLEIPLVADDCLPQADYQFEESNLKGYNLLCPYYKVRYSSVNPSLSSNQMIYALPYKVDASSCGEYITAVFTDMKGNKCTHKIQIDENGFADEGKLNEADGLRMCLWYSTVYFKEDGQDGVDGAFKVLSGQPYIKNDLEITVPVKDYVANRSKVLNMTKAIRYGGDSVGFANGSRLFLTGNNNNGEQSLLMWSSADSPLYFSHNAYVYIGDESQAVTALSKASGEMLVFKENETYRMSYSTTDKNIDDGNIKNVLVSGNIGCDCPDTIQLCRNCLVWADSKGKIYTLVSTNQNDERSVYEVSEMIERRLSSETLLKNAKAVDYDGHYILQVGNKLYVMDYNSYGYNYVSSYSKAEDANMKIPWYCWKIAEEDYIKTQNIMLVSDRLLLTYSCGVEGDDTLDRIINTAYIDGASGDDEIGILEKSDSLSLELRLKKIMSSFQTKLFDFGKPHKQKNVSSVWLSLGYNREVPIAVECISEKPTEDRHTVTVEGTLALKYSPEYIHQLRLFPYTKGTVLFGLRLSCEGEMVVDSITVKYRDTGFAG